MTKDDTITVILTNIYVAYRENNEKGFGIMLGMIRGLLENGIGKHNPHTLEEWLKWVREKMDA